MSASRGPLLHGLFEQQAADRPDAVAVVCEQHALTFAQLDRRASGLARHLQSCGIGPDQLVVLCLERSVEMLVGMIGIWKAGGAYVPLDPSYPVERIAQVVNDSEARVILTQQSLAPRLSALAEHCVLLDAEDESLNPPAGEAHQAALTDRNLAYVIYTSGSSGNPKGVMVEHRSVVNLWHALRPIYPEPGIMRRVAVNAALTFDSSVKQLIQLLSGSTLYIVPQVLRLHARMLLRYLDSERIDAIDCTPTQLKTWIAAGLFERSAATPRMVLIGGEAIDPGLWRGLAQYQRIAFHNVYGPTECTVDATCAQVVEPDTEPHIGRALYGVQTYVLDADRRPVAAGEVGEIWIGGAGVARGYLMRPELTGERFVPDPFDTAGARLYRTGDLGRWRSDGNLQYLGRNDAQVKIRGMRIELGEIEAALSRHPEVREVAVILLADAASERRLVAYVGMVTDSTAPSSTAAELRNFLSKLLPEHMVPSEFMILDRLPVNTNGKVDRRALQGAGSHRSTEQRR